MSTKYPGGFITKSPVAPTTTAASGVWTLDQQQQYQKAGTWPAPPIFIEDLFSTYLYTGTNANQTIVNGIDLAGQGGLVWNKVRGATGNTSYHYLVDTARGRAYGIASNATDAQYTSSAGNDLSAFTSTGYTLGPKETWNAANFLDASIVSWTFRKQPKFFDVVTYTGDGVSGRTVSHSLGAVPGFIITKPVSTSGAWAVAARKSDGNYAYGASTYAFGLNSNEQATSRSVSGLATDTTFTPASVADVGTCNNSGVTYVAYLFAHDAGGFPASGAGSTNGISCGSFVTGSGGKMTAPVNLGYEPQWLLIKNISSGENWTIYDTMRGLSYAGYNVLYPNTSAAEYSSTTALVPTATGFDTPNASGPFATSANYIYVAIRRGPMKTPTTGTSVFDPEAYSGDNSNTRVITTGFPPDMVWTGTRANGSRRVGDRLRGLFTNPGPVSTTSSTSDEQLDSYSSPQMSGWQTGNGTVRFENSTGVDYVLHAFRRAPGFFDVVCYTGTGSNTTQTHNLGVAPELVIIKSRSNAIVWVVGNTTIGFANYLLLNTTDASASGSNVFNSTAPTSTVFSIGTGSGTNQSGATYVAYLFATLAGVSKVGSYTGTSAAQTINCGFTSGARFVLIKNASDFANWYLYDSARGITAGDDPYLLINSSSAEVTSTNYVDTDTTGFKLTAAAPAALNFSGDTYIFLAIA